MAEQREVIRVFLASPGGLDPERAAAARVVENVNRRWSSRFGVQFELVRWESAPRGYGRAQGIINKELARCELFVGMLWKEWGSPTGEYSSGFEEEFRVSEKSLNASGKPEIKLFFKAVDRDDPGVKLQKVLTFQEEVRTKVFYDEFKDTKEFEEKLEDCLCNFLQGVGEPATNQAEAPRSETASTAPAAPDGPSRIDADTAQFVTEFLAGIARASNDTELDAAACARLRLIANSLSGAGNDEVTLGVHDANLLFARRRELKLSPQEVRRLVEAALVQQEREIVPLWHWVIEAGGIADAHLALRALFGPISARAGALRTMRLINLPFEEERFLTRANWLEQLLGSEASDEVKLATLEYLQECGTEEDLSILAREDLRSNYRTSAAATTAAIKVMLRNGRESVVEALVRIQPDAVDADLTEQMFSKPDLISDAALQACLPLRASNVRAKAIRLLAERRRLDANVAEGLLADDAVQVRLEALWGLHISGRSFSDEEAKQILVRAKRRTGLFGFVNSSETEGQSQLDEYKRRVLSALSKTQLEQAVNAETILDRRAWLHRAELEFKTYGNELRTGLTDRFEAFFDSAVAPLADSLPKDLLERIGTLKPAIRADLSRRALSIIARKGGGQDIHLVRSALEDESVLIGSDELRFLERFGEWTDVDLILQKLRGYSSGTLILGSNLPSEIMVASAHALCVLSRGRLLDFLKKDASLQVQERVIALWRAREFADLTVAQLNKLLRYQQDGLRRLFALKALNGLSKRRCSDLLDAYMSASETHYYNVVHWLDCAVTLPATIAKAAAKRAIEDGASGSGF